MDDYYIEVSPIIIYPTCHFLSKNENCLTCELRLTGCASPRSLCVKPYRNHKHGCPNYGKKKDCPPNAPMFDLIYDINRKVYAIYYKFDLRAHVEKMRKLHPTWTQAQLLNVLYWQGSARKMLRGNITRFNELFFEEGYCTTTSAEAMGVDITKTMQNAGIILEWPARNVVHKIALAGIPL